MVTSLHRLLHRFCYHGLLLHCSRLMALLLMLSRALLYYTFVHYHLTLLDMFVCHPAFFFSKLMKYLSSSLAIGYMIFTVVLMHDFVGYPLVTIVYCSNYLFIVIYFLSLSLIPNDQFYLLSLSTIEFNHITADTHSQFPPKSISISDSAKAKSSLESIFSSFLSPFPSLPLSSRQWPLKPFR